MNNQWGTSMIAGTVGSLVVGLIPASIGAAAETSRTQLLEEILVTAQRVEERESEVPIAMSAFNEADIEDRRIIGIGELSLFVPSMGYVPNNVGDATLSIRGVGSLTQDADADPGVSLHINEVPLAPGQPPLELYDLTRIEVLRGPQSTLYGRNATGGVVNLITTKPTFDGPGGYLDLEAGNEDLRRLRGAMNFNVVDSFAIRLAGLFLDRDGYTDNLAGGQVPGVPNEIDGRDLFSIRTTAIWRITDHTEVWGLYERFDEDDDRLLWHNRLCKTAQMPVTRAGCEPGEFGLEAHNPNQPRINTFLANGLRGMIPLGARDAETGLVFRYPRPVITDLRDVHVDIAPIYEYQQDLFQIGASHGLDWGEFSFLGGYQDWRLRSVYDHDWSVGHELAAIPENPSGLWPVAKLPDVEDPLDGPVCNVNAGQVGVLGGCVYASPSREMWRSETRKSREAYSLELRLRSTSDGRFNYLFGASYQHTDFHSLGAAGNNDYNDTWALFGGSYVANRAVDPYEIATEPPFRIATGGFEDNVQFESYSEFAEVYVDLTDKLKLTIAGRYNRDEKRLAERQVVPALDVNARYLGEPDEPLWVRADAIAYAFGVSANPGPLDFYGLTQAVDAARAAGGPSAALQVASTAPLLTAWNETRTILGLPTKFDWEAVSGRLVLDWRVIDDVLTYASYARGYRPGGFNRVLSATAQTEYGREDVNSYELGAKARLAANSLSLSAAVFFNDYEDMQLASHAGVRSGSIVPNRNVDSEILGAEFEVRWRPIFAPQAEVELGYSWLQTELRKIEPEIDPLWLSNGDPSYVELYSFASGAPAGSSGRYVARIDEVLPLVDAAIAIGAAFGPDQVPAGIYPNGIPALFDGLFLQQNGVEILPGIPVDVAGNRIPDTPEHTLHSGISYTWDVPFGAVTARWDYYWQSSSYLTIFNRRHESTGEWEQHDASLIYESLDARWSVRAWIRNIGNEAHILGGYRGQVNQDFSVTEPRAYGVSVRYSFGRP